MKHSKPTIAHDMSEENSTIPATASVKLSTDALISNWRSLDKLSGRASAGAAVKADAYGLDAKAVVSRLLSAGCTDFYVANWQEAKEIEGLVSDQANVSVLNGVRESDMAFAVKSNAKPVLNSIEQVRRWQQTDRPCDIMINSGMNRLGIDVTDLEQLDINGLKIDIAMSHLASADEDCDQNIDQLQEFQNGLSKLTPKRKSLANSAGIALGDEYHFDCTRPGLSLYGGVQRPELEGLIKQVATPQAEIIQTRTLKPGDRLGYNAQYIADREHDVAILAIGYADGYLRGFSGSGIFQYSGKRLDVLGRVSMDLIAVDISDAPALSEGDWVDAVFNLPEASKQSGISQYELITGLGQRLPRIWK